MLRIDRGKSPPLPATRVKAQGGYRISPVEKPAGESKTIGAIPFRFDCQTALAVIASASEAIQGPRKKSGLRRRKRSSQ